tara:strand:+ start:782 stop:2227 length:1446 start_codon:yes stop_codon:yes gene_type:complete
MVKREGYIKKEDRKTILLLCDDMRMHSGIATMAREIVAGSVHKYNWVQLAAAINHPDQGKAIDLSEDFKSMTKIEDPDVKIFPNSGYGDAMRLRALLAQYNPSAVMIFTDPRYWGWLFDLEREIRQHIPIFYLNIWDDYPAPYYNRNAYDSCDLLMGISKQTVNINKLVLGERAKGKVIKYVPHGINEDRFFKMDKNSKDYKEFSEFRDSTFGNKEINYVVFFNSRNIKRKSPADLMLAYRYFCDMIGDDAAKKTALVLHTKAVDQNGTDLMKIKELFFKPKVHNVFFSQQNLSPDQMKWLYNIADLTVLPSSNEGWGLSLTESMMCETMIAANVTGGMQDQMRFVDEKGKWIDFDENFPSNHTGKYKEHGEWAIPFFPSCRSLVGSVPTPYIFDDKCSPEDICKAIKQAYDLGPEERARRGKLGRDWALSDEAQMSGQAMANNFINAAEETFLKFKKRPKFDLIKVEERKKDYITHKLKY